MAYDLVKQIPTLVNDAVKDALGKNYDVTQADTTDVVSLGKLLASVDNGYDGWFGALAKRIAKTVYFVRQYEGSNRSVLRDEHEYGAFIQKIYYEMPDAVNNPTWEIPDTNGDFKQKSPYDVSTSIGVSSVIFGGKGTWSIEIVRPITQIKQAFLNPSEMGAFIDGIYTVIMNAFKLEEERLVALAVNTAMAVALDGGCAFNILAKFNDEYSKNYTKEQAIKDADFIRFATFEVKQIIKNMRKMSTAFNKAKYETFTDGDNLVVEMLTRFVEASDVYLQSDTFHNELVALPNYEEVDYWQSSGVNFSFADCSKINIAHDDLDAESVEQDGIIAFVHDRENVACYFGDRRSWEMVNPRSDVVIHGEKAEKGYAIDDHANAVVVYMGSTGALTLTQPSAHGTAVASTEKVYRGNPILVTVTPDSGYEVDEVTCGGADLEKVADNKYLWSPKTDDNITIVVTVKQS
ncbi:MAG: hypothetical protein MJ007_04845 [Paludibacteraceae bacterium]|nr:hypothetical protein [Paludibacteraceae bacterium]